MGEPQVDHPGEVVWYIGYHPEKVIGPCPHTECAHDMLLVVAEGPDFDHYTLDRCDVAPDRGGCGGMCRAWCVEWPTGTGPGNAHGGWLHLDARVPAVHT